MAINIPSYNPNQINEANLLQGQVLAQQQALQQQALNQELERQLAPYKMQEVMRQQQRQPAIDALNDELKKVQILNTRRQVEEALKTPQQRFQEAFLLGAAQRGELGPAQAQQEALSPIPVMPTETPFVSAPLGESAGIPQGVQMGGMNDILAQIMGVQAPSIPQASQPARAPRGMSFPELPAGTVWDPERVVEQAARIAAARRSPVPEGFERFTDEFGNERIIQTKGAGAGTGVSKKITDEEGGGVKALPKAAKGGLTAFQQNGIISKASFENIDYTSPEYTNPETGQVDYTKLNADASKSRRIREDAEKKGKIESLTGKAKDDLSNLYAVQSQLTRFRDAIEDFDKTGKEPGLIQNSLAVVGNSPSSGIFSSWKRQFARGALSEDSKLKENLRGSVSSAVQSAISGKVITKLEAQQLGFIPQADDTIDDLVDKGEILENWINDKISGISRAQGVTPTPSSPSGTNTPPPSGLTPAAQEFLRKRQGR